MSQSRAGRAAIQRQQSIQNDISAFQPREAAARSHHKPGFELSLQLDNTEPPLPRQQFMGRRRNRSILHPPLQNVTTVPTLPPVRGIRGQNHPAFGSLTAREHRTNSIEGANLETLSPSNLTAT